MKYFLSICLILFGTKSLAENRAKIEISQKKEGGAYLIKFIVSPANKELKLNLEAPWRLQVKSNDPAVFPKTKLEKTDLDPKLPGFALKTASLSLKDKMTVPYEMTAFTCTKDRSQCFRELIKGELLLSPN